jgi:predicted Fe-S protein YdhL (DUF1289 family)
VDDAGDDFSSTTATNDADGRRARRRERRRRAQERRFDTSVPSPCIQVCQVDEADTCIGCLRHVDEIRDWPIMTAEEKRETLARIETRKAEKAKAATSGTS